MEEQRRKILIVDDEEPIRFCIVLTLNMKGYETVSVDEKMKRLKEKLAEFSEDRNIENQIQIVKEWPSVMDPEVTYFNISTREYTKRLSKIEIEFMLFLLMPIKFYPVAT